MRARARRYVPIEASDFGHGLLPNIPSTPAGGSVTVLSMIATTCIPFNMFLAASMSETATMGQMKRGIAFASLLTALISVLIVVIGSDIDVPKDEDFGVEDLGYAIYDKLGSVAQICFCIGLYAAAYSSAITIPLGAALTAQQIFLEGRFQDHASPNTAVDEQLDNSVTSSDGRFSPVAREDLEDGGEGYVSSSTQGVSEGKEPRMCSPRSYPP